MVKFGVVCWRARKMNRFWWNLEWKHTPRVYYAAQIWSSAIKGAWYRRPGNFQNWSKLQFFALQEQPWIPIKVKFGRQSTLWVHSHAKFVRDRWRGLETGALKIQNLVKIAVFRSVFSPAKATLYRWYLARKSMSLDLRRCAKCHPGRWRGWLVGTAILAVLQQLDLD